MCWESPSKRENKIKKIVPMCSYLTRNRKLKKKAKNIKNLENTIIASFQGKICWQRLRKGEKKNRSDCVPTRSVVENSKKIAKKFKNLENTIVASFQAKIGWNRTRKRERKKKKIVLMCFYPTRNRKL